MNELSLLTTLALVHLVALASPGPDFALVVQNASRYGRRIGLAIALGISLAILLHSVFALTGVSLLIQQHPMLPVVMRVAGGSYLLYLGLGALRSAYQQWRVGSVGSLGPATALVSPWAALVKGFTTNLLNPKALVFFLSLLTSLVPPSVSSEGKVAAIVILWGLSLAWFSGLAWVLTGARMQRQLQRLTPYIDGICGALFTLVGGGILIATLMA
ncbi:Lysine exporter protein (LYSE/YGGA) [Ferrimonas balearica DSM 9799]|uniref:Lysine exporter protein (LYSE/YGGA) n=1 Tax=Ferrimonas balearica (strain DSM 9799 / CCM 4581 / KCTC 23876 / PAT) TaxID=550540 RepID=E1SQG6_FERBD|nr:LysE family transporter [Ferrimonas balearica]ADN74778.1 Lysine exporter protein (LYSE/YGGA) [Ferrimonas balearica DSM 9799]MBW3140583.1 LysE family transporter [Ferrimonas balearica]MBW3165440.1 LysE family transporter [Ferrimonas balearica]MBY6107614.1 LysE family transporter [Ferrimonas balearica]MBY6226264.1 LysE family transporter [Ferrimonas balearica]